MEMDDELENFIRERKARIAEDKDNLKDPPYMEMRNNVRRAQDSAMKENIPPSCRTTVPGKEESFCVGLPLGVDYAKKKQRLQQELRMDFRRYMAQKNRLDTGEPGASEGSYAKERLVPHPPSVVQGPSSHAKRGPAAAAASERDPAPTAEVKTTTERANRPLRRRNSHEELLGRESGEDEGGGGGGGGGGEERREPDECGRPQRHAGVQAGAGSGRSYRANGEKRETPAGGARGDRRSRLSANRDQTVFATGLLIGAVDGQEALRKRQERYRQELEEQIADQQRRKRREKELEMSLAASGAPDLEKQLDHIKYMSLNRRREGTAAGAGAPYTCPPTRENRPPEPVHVAFQSPLLEYSAALGDGLLSPCCQPGPPPLQRALDMPRIPGYLPHPPMGPAEGVYRSLCHDACHYQHHHHHLPHCGVASGGGFPTSYWAVPPGAAVPQPERHSQHGQQYAGSLLVPDPPPPPPAAAAGATWGPMRAAAGAVSTDSLAGAVPGDRAHSTKEKMLSYKEALKQQVASPPHQTPPTSPLLSPIKHKFS